MAPNNMLQNTRSILDYLNRTDQQEEATPRLIAAQLDIPQRRVYDILSVLETLQIVEKHGRRYTVLHEQRPISAKNGAISQLVLAVLRLLRLQEMKPQQLLNVLKEQSFPPRRCYDVLSVMEAADAIQKNDKQELILSRFYDIASPDIKVLFKPSMRNEVCDDELIALLIGLKGF